MKKTSKIFMALALSVCLCLTAVLFVGCGAKKPLTDQALTGEVIADFSDGKVGSVFASDGWTNGNVVWKASNVTYSDGAMHLGIKEEAASAWVDGESVDYQFTGGEARTTMHYGFGDYEVSMKPAKKVGTASTFFVCTGSYDLVDGVENPWDEIDIEFLGQDTTRVQFNYFVNGVGGHEHMYDLGFDASEQYHTYGFRWTENYIVWFVDSEPVYKVKASSTKAMPSAPGRILMNYWCGNEDAEGWMGKFSGAETGETVDYKWIKTSAEASYVDGEAPVEPGDDSSELVGFDLSAATFNGETADYNVTQSDGALIATYENIAGNSYKNINTDVKDFAADKKYVTLKITNNGENQANVRIDLDSETKVSETTAANTDATVAGDGAIVYTDTTWGGSVFTIPAGATVTATVYFDNARIVKTLMFYFDSSKYDDKGTHTGSITLSECAFAKDEQGEQPEQPAEVITMTEFDLSAATFNGETADYNVTQSDGALIATYENIAGNSYKNINTDVKDFAADKKYVTLKITNNGENQANVRIDLDSETKVSETTAANTDATVAGDGAIVYTDTTWGGSVFTIPAGATVTATVYFDNARIVKTLMFYFDSSKYDDEGTHTGSITLSECAFAKVEQAEQPKQPEQPVDNTVALSFGSTEIYTVTPSGEAAKSVTVTYSEVGGQSYKTISAYIGTVASGSDTFTVTIRNNGEAAVRLRFDVQGTTQVGNTAAINTNAWVNSEVDHGVYTDTTWGGSFVTVAAGEEVVLTVIYDESTAKGAVNNLIIFIDSATDNGDTHSGNVTLSQFTFSKSVQASDAE